MTRAGVAAIATIDDLSGKTVHVRKVVELLREPDGLERTLQEGGQARAKLVLVPDALEDEDMLEMLNAGLLQAMVVDDWKAQMWAQVLPKLKVHEDIVLREPTAKTGWAIRKDSPKLAAVLDDSTAARQEGGRGRASTDGST